MKKQLLVFVLATTLKLLFIPQFASAQSSRIWATYYGGKGDDNGTTAATDPSGNVYLTGATTSLGLASGGFQDTLGTAGGYINTFLVKFDANGNRLWATYYGGDNECDGNIVATDAAGNVYLAGLTFCTTGMAYHGFHNTYAGNGDAFLVKFDANGNRLWATYYGGADFDYAQSVSIDAAGNIYLAGQTSSSDSIASGGFQNTFEGWQDAFLVKFDANGNRLWATYYGGFGGGEIITDGRSVNCDVAGNVYLGGTTNSFDSIAFGGFYNYFLGANQDAFLVKFDANGNRLWATYYGSTSWNEGNSVATDASGNVYLGGNTNGADNIAYHGFQNTFGGGGYADAFLVKFNAIGNRLWATYYGASGNEENSIIGTDAAGNVYLAGQTTSSDSIASGGFQDSLTLGNGPNTHSLFLVKFDSSGHRLCATYYDGSFIGKVPNTGLALDNAGNAYLASTTGDTTGIASGGFQNTLGGGNWDADLVKFTPCGVLTPVANFQSSDTALCLYDCINYTDLSTNATSWQWTFTGGTPGYSTVQNPQGICYYASGIYDSKLIVSNGGLNDTLTVINLIKVFPTPPTPVITQHDDTLYCTTDSSYTSYQWYDSTTLIPGATDTFLIVNHGGNYNVAVTNEFGCKISVGITIPNNVGINEFSTNNYVSLSPNPVSDKLNIICHGLSRSKAELFIYNVLGEKMLSNSLFLEEGGEVFNVSNLSPGIYFLQLKTGRYIDRKRFVKE